MKLTNEEQYKFDVAREAISDALEKARRVKSSRETSIVITKIQEAALWLSIAKEEAEK